MAGSEGLYAGWNNGVEWRGLTHIVNVFCVYGQCNYVRISLLFLGSLRLRFKFSLYGYYMNSKGRLHYERSFSMMN